jgi:hypothetical protein
MKTVMQYLILVGLPIIGVFGLLQIGQRLTPPVSVGGNWLIEVTPEAGGNATCGQFLTQSGRPRLTISQSGPRLVLTFNDAAKTALPGRIDDLTLTAATPDISVMTSVDRQVEPNRLQGEIAFSNCAESVPFQAVRQVAVKKSAGGH